MQHLCGLAVRHPIQELQHTHAQQQHRFHRDPAIVRTITGGQLPASRRQPRINDFTKEPVTIVFREETGRETGRGEQERLGREIREAHKSPAKKGDFAVVIWLPYRVALENASPICDQSTSDPFQKASPPILCEYPAAAGGRIRSGTRRARPVATPQPERSPVAPGERPGTTILTQAYVPALILTFILA